MEKSKKKKTTLNLSGSFVACDLKVGRYRKHVELMKCCEYKMSRSFLTLAKSHYKLNVKLNFLSNHMTNQSQIYMLYHWNEGTKVYINGQGHLTKMAAMAINSKNL